MTKHKLTRSFILFAIFFCLSPIPLFGAPNNINTPELGAPSHGPLGQAEQRKMGREFMRAVATQMPLLTDPIIDNYIKQLGQRLANQTPTARTMPLHFFMVDASDINAFAGPGGYIGINSGLFLATKSEGELAAVLSHEIAHEVQQHLIRSQEQESALRWPSLAGLAAAIALGAYNPDLGTGAVHAAMAGLVQHQINFTRSQEEEADRVGMEILYRAGFNPFNMPNFFARLQQQTRLYPSVPAIFQTHPLTQERIADAENRANQFPKQNRLIYSEYPLIYVRLEVLTTQNPYALFEQFKKKMQTANPNNATRYGYALLLAGTKHAQLALQELAQLATLEPNQWIYPFTRAEIAAQTQKFDIALNLLHELHALYPENPMITNAYAHTLLLAQKPNQALLVLQKSELDEPNSHISKALLAKVQAAAGLKGEAYLTRAQLFVQQGLTKSALHQIKFGLQVANLHQTTRLRLQALEKSLKATSI